MGRRPLPLPRCSTGPSTPIDVDGAGRFAALGRDGRERAIGDARRPDGLTEIDFEQSAELLTVGHRRHLDRPAPTDDVDIAVYRIALEPPPPAPIALFPTDRGLPRSSWPRC